MIESVRGHADGVGPDLREALPRPRLAAVRRGGAAGGYQLLARSRVLVAIFHQRMTQATETAFVRELDRRSKG